MRIEIWTQTFDTEINMFEAYIWKMDELDVEWGKTVRGKTITDLYNKVSYAAQEGGWERL